MREIKFRVWDKHLNKFIDFDSINKVVFTDISYIFQQFTGIKTRDSKEIYEGDIVQFIKPDYVGIVEFAGCQYLIKDLYDKEYFGYLSVGIDYKILGNIYENPELLIKKEASYPEIEAFCKAAREFGLNKQ